AVGIIGPLPRGSSLRRAVLVIQLRGGPDAGRIRVPEAQEVGPRLGGPDAGRVRVPEAQEVGPRLGGPDAGRVRVPKAQEARTDKLPPATCRRIPENFLQSSRREYAL